MTCFCVGSYCVNITFYIMLKAKKSPVHNHPVITRLLQFRNVSDTVSLFLRPCYLSERPDHVVAHIAPTARTCFHWHLPARRRARPRYVSRTKENISSPSPCILGDRSCNRHWIDLYLGAKDARPPSDCPPGERKTEFSAASILVFQHKRPFHIRLAAMEYPCCACCAALATAHCFCTSEIRQCGKTIIFQRALEKAKQQVLV